MFRTPEPYSVNPDGMGLVSVNVFLPGNLVQPANIDLVITKADYIRGEKIGTEMATAQRETSTVLGGEFVTHVLSRRSD